MHPIVRLHLVAMIVAVQLAALFVDRAVPYWPIEVSRMAASGWLASRVFVAGAVTLGVTMYMVDSLSAMNAAVWAAIVVIAVFDDIAYYKTHMAGVALLGVIGIAGIRGKPEATLPLVAAIMLWGFRLVLKVGAVLAYEPVHTFVQAGQLAQRIMMTGPAACANAKNTMPAFFIGGVLQWVVFYVLSLCI